VADYANILFYEVINSVYVPVGCSNGHMLVNLIESTGTKGCISIANINYHINCVSYLYSTDFICRECGPASSPLQLLPVRINNILINKCPLNSS